MKHVGFTIPEPDFERYRQMARVDGRSLSGWIRQRLAEAAKAIEKGVQS